MSSNSANPELSSRWSEWLLRRNERGMRGVLSIVVCLYPAFGVLDYLVAPREWLPLLYATRIAITVVTLVLFRVLGGPLFRRHPYAISASYIVMVAIGITSMTFFMGGLGSPYYAGLSLVILGSGILFVWPLHVVAPTYSAIVLSFLIANLAVGEAADLMTAISNHFFLISTAIIAGTGQALGYRSQREMIGGQLALEHASLELASAHEKLKNLDRFKSEFFANVTHELKTPLTLILAPLALLIEGQLGVVSDAQRSTLQSMQRSGVKLSRLIGDLLDLSKLEESRLRLRVEPNDLVAYLDGLLQQVEPLAARKNLALSFQADVPQAEICCDIERLERVFINLLSNATKFTDAGGRVSVRLQDERDAVLVEVEDTGVGFPMELSEDVFRRFFQAETGKARRFGGAGIGLALAKELVELHGGSIWARSAPGQGATFSVRLLKGRDHFRPEALDRRSGQSDLVGGQREGDNGLSEWQLDTPEHFRLFDIDQATEQRRVERDQDEHEREHSVLVVEDTPDVARIIRLALHHEFRVLVAGDGQQGLELARRYRPSVIITDLMMPRMDGLALTAELRRDPETRQIPIVMLSARSDVDDKVRGLETGVSAYLGKPFAASEIVSTVRSLMRRQQAAADSLLAQKMDSLETIAGGLAHEILNPLNYLKNALLSVQKDSQSLVDVVRNTSAPPDSGVVEKLDGRMRKMFEVSQAGVQRIAGTVDLMVRYSREGYARSLRLHDAYGAVRDVVAIVRASVAREASVEIDLEGSGLVHCVPEELNQVLTNLIQNALEAVAPDATGHVLVRGRNQEGDLILSVRDNGPGIPERERGRIFDPFFTTKQAGHGMGLGLTICRRVVVAMGGTLALKSELGRGSEFTVRVPSAVGREAVG
ncbi:MAG TPA: ATP-binding protein [Polyangiaceae bacterium]|nr:ATP-binding protein [Polyangiaceae bacterium]